MITVMYAICLIFTGIVLFAGYRAVRSTILEEGPIRLTLAGREATLQRETLPSTGEHIAERRWNLRHKTSANYPIPAAIGNFSRYAAIYGSFAIDMQTTKREISNAEFTGDNREVLRESNMLWN